MFSAFSLPASWKWRGMRGWGRPESPRHHMEDVSFSLECQVAFVKSSPLNFLSDVFFLVDSGLVPSGHMRIASHLPSWDTVTDQKSRRASLS